MPLDMAEPSKVPVSSGMRWHSMALVLMVGLIMSTAILCVGWCIGNDRV